MVKPSVEILKEVAATKGVDPSELEAVLFDAVDPQALDALFADRETTDGFVQFVFADCEIKVSANGDIETTELDE